MIPLIYMVFFSYYCIFNGYCIPTSAYFDKIQNVLIIKEKMTAYFSIF